MYLISAYFDENISRILQRWIDKTAEATGNRFMTENRVPPHLTLSAVDLRPGEEAALVDAVKTLNPESCRGEIFIPSLGQLFPYVIFAAPVLNRYLQGLSEEIFGRVSSLTGARISRFYRPFSWMPHITLGKTLEKEQLYTAFRVMQEQFVPLRGQIASVGLARTNPYRELMRIYGE